VVVWHDGPPPWFAAAPFRQLIEWTGSVTGALLVHGAMVGRAEGGVLLLGSGGAGKSTTAMAVLAAGGVSTGDDYEWVVQGDSPVRGQRPQDADPWQCGKQEARVRSLSCFRSFKSRMSARVAAPPVLASAPGLDILPPAQEGKRVHFVGEAGVALVREQAVLGVLTLEPHGSAPSAPRRIPTSLALVRAAPSTVLQATHLRQVAMGRLTRLVSGLPCYSLALEPDLDRMAAMVLGLVDELLDSTADPAGAIGEPRD
jgi:hypothetical protein